MNSGISIYTLFLEEYLRGGLNLHIVKSPLFPKRSMEMELLSHGYTSMQNKLKHYLIANQIAQIPEKSAQGDTVLEISRDYAYRVILETAKLCTMRSGAEDNEGVTRAIHNLITDDLTEVIQAIEQFGENHPNAVASKTVYFYPKIDTDSNSLMSAAICLVGKELFPDETISASQQRHIRRLLTQKARKQSDTRRDLIRAAYRLKMTLEEMNLFLTKAAFTYRLDYTDPWELRAAYLTVHSPVKNDDSPMIFDLKMKALTGNCAGAASQLVPFLTSVLRQKMDLWFGQWQKHNEQGLGTEFLMDWCWYTYIYGNEKVSRKSAFQSREVREQAEEALGTIYQNLEMLVRELPPQKWLQFLSDAPDGYTHNLTDCLLDRQFRLLQLLYRRSRKLRSESFSFQIRNRAGECVGIYTPFFREDGFVHLDRNLRKVENPERPLSRSDIISLGIELYVDREEIDRALQCAGFHKLYVKDIYERALIIVLEAEKLDLSLEQLGKYEQMKLRVLHQLDALYNVLSRQTCSQLIKTEPEWVRRLRKNDQE